VPTASITVALGAATTPAPSAGSNRCDGTSRVQFNDPFSEVSELINCHGTLAIGGFCTNSETRVVGGNTFRRITEGDVTVNNGFSNCFTATDLAEVLTHELGHTIGLGHSSNNTNELDPARRDATMYYRAHFDGRGAALRADDVAGVTTIYPGDRDHDGVGDDACPDTLTGEAVDGSGCACSDPGHVSCDDGDACTIDDCRASSGACAHTAIRCGDGDPCSIDSCSAGECLHAAAVGTRYVTCYFDTPLACDATVPAAVRRSFQQAAALARGASAANAIVNTERLFRRADRRLTRASAAIDRAMVRRRAPIDAACGAALHEIVDEALGRVRAVEY
jgi:hypothetical protein